MASRNKTAKESSATRVQTARSRIYTAKQELTRTALGPLLNGLTVAEANDSDTRPSIGAADPVQGVLYVNPYFVGPRNRPLESAEWKYVIAHLALHLALNHATRREGRDPFVWNLACDVTTDRLLALFQIARPLSVAGELWPSDANEDALYDELMAIRQVDRGTDSDSDACGGRANGHSGFSEGRSALAPEGRRPTCRRDSKSRIGYGHANGGDVTVRRNRD